MRHKLTHEEQLRGTRNALKSPRTPKHLRKYLEKRLKQLEGHRGSGGRRFRF